MISLRRTPRDTIQEVPVEWDWGNSERSLVSELQNIHSSETRQRGKGCWGKRLNIPTSLCFVFLAPRMGLRIGFHTLNSNCKVVSFNDITTGVVVQEPSG
jgi:hypothetical protein